MNSVIVITNKPNRIWIGCILFVFNLVPMSETTWWVMLLSITGFANFILINNTHTKTLTTRSVIILDAYYH